MSHIFISYAREDLEFAQQLVNTLEQSGREVWIDLKGIPATVDWWKEIEKAIEEADAVLSLISPDYVTSVNCGREVDHAIQHGKRLIPLVVRDVTDEQAPSRLKHLNYIFFSRPDDFDTAFEKLSVAIQTDYGWVQEQRWLQVRAVEWEREKRERSFLLRGKDLKDAEEQLARNASKPPHPTELQAQYVMASRKAADAQTRLVTFISAVTVIVLATLALFGFYQANNATNAQATAEANLAVAQTAQADAQNKQILADNNASTAIANKDEAEKQAQISRSSELVVQSKAVRERDFAEALLLGLEAFGVRDTVQTQSLLIENAYLDPQLRLSLYGKYIAVFNQDGEILASASDSDVILLNSETGQPISQPMRGHSGTITCLAFSPDGKMLASGSRDNTIILWNTETKRSIGQPLVGHTGSVVSIAFSPDGKTLASSGGYFDPRILIWDIENRRQIDQPLQSGGKLSGIVFSPDGKILVGGDADGAITLWSVSTRQRIGQPMHKQAVEIKSIALSPDGKILASGSSDGTIILWDMITRKAMGQPLKRHSRPVYSIAFSPNGKFLVSGSWDNTVIFWDVGTHDPIGQPLTISSDILFGIELVSFSPDGNELIIADKGTASMIWNFDTGGIVNKNLRGNLSLVNSVAFSPDGTILASGDAAGNIALWNAETGELVDQLQNQTGLEIESIIFGAEGQILVSCDEGGNIVFWDFRIGQTIDPPPFTCGGYVAFNPNNNILVTSSGGKIILWDMKMKQILDKSLDGYGATFSHDGKLLAYIHDEMIIVWDMILKRRIKQLAIKPDISDVLFSPDGKSLAFVQKEDVILWGLNDGKTLRLADSRGHTELVTSIAFSPDGKILASAGWDSTIILWDTASGNPMGPRLRNVSRMHPLVFSAKGNILASGTSAATVIIWDIDPVSWMQTTCLRAGRNFTRAEWEQYFPNESYRKTCEQWPLEPEAVPTPSPSP